ncbi:MAG: hypothetical protein KIT79_15965 [Deltaproteobacteria bacterium]|nr:hypothetical protein [Deltaproteobacteria bacterium]
MQIAAPGAGSVRFEEEKKRLIWGTRYVDTCVMMMGVMFFPLWWLEVVDTTLGIAGAGVVVAVLTMGIIARYIYANAPDPLSMYAVVNFGMVIIIGLIAVLVHFSGGIWSFMVGSYFLVAVGCSVFVSFRNAIFLNAFSALSFYGVCMLEIYGVLPRHSFATSPFEGMQANARFAGAYAFSLFPFLTLVSYASWFFAQRLRSAEDRLDAEQQERLAEIGMFSSVIAHEFKNPLGVIKGAVEVVMDDSDPATRTEMLGHVRQEVIRLDRMVRTLLDYSKPQKLELEPVTVGDVIDEVLVFFDPPREKKVQIRFHSADAGPHRVRADVEKLKQVLLNLLSNAVEAAPPESSVQFILRRDRETAAIDVIDQGAGIPEDVQAKLFQPFHTTKAKGTGLGLAISRRIVEAHGGTLTFVTRPGEGTTFTVRLPAEDPAVPSGKESR